MDIQTIDLPITEIVQQYLEEGDNFIITRDYELAIKTWLQIPNFKEKIEERIMQVCDYLYLQAQVYAKNKKLHNALHFLTISSLYAHDKVLLSLNQQLKKNIEQQIQQSKLFLYEATVNITNKHYQQALESIHNAWNLCIDDEEIIKERKNILTWQWKKNKDEQEYKQLLNTSRSLESEKKYAEALSILQTVQQKKEQWICAVFDVTQDIARVSTLYYDQENNRKASEILSLIQEYLNKNKLRHVSQLFLSPVFKESLTPEIKQLYDQLFACWTHKYKQRKQYFIYTIIASFILACVLFCFLG